MNRNIDICMNQTQGLVHTVQKIGTNKELELMHKVQQIVTNEELVRYICFIMNRELPSDYYICFNTNKGSVRIHPDQTEGSVQINMKRRIGTKDIFTQRTEEHIVTEEHS